MSPLGERLRAQIARTGPIGVDTFFASAMGDAEHGYYATRNPLGRGGDFITAPEISQVFGELIGAWCVAVWRALGAPDPIRLVELGPGHGTLLADLWRGTAAVAPEFIAAVRLHLVEISAPLRACQQDALSTLVPQGAVVWHESLSEVPDGPLLLVANEFFDALPIRQFVAEGGVWRERRVGLSADGKELAFVTGSEGDLGEDFAPFEGEIVERCPAGEALAAEIAGRIAHCGGCALIIDYGHTRSATGETLQAASGHRRADPLMRPGEADLSHHVDFTRLRIAAQEAGAVVSGPIAQGLFLGRLGIAERGEALAGAAATPAVGEAVRGAVRRLVHPGRMGVLFKAMAIAHPASPDVPGFAAAMQAGR